MITVFERIPQFFVDHYDKQFRQWSREYRSKGQERCIPLDRPRGAPKLFNPNGEPLIPGVWLKASFEWHRNQLAMIVRPRTEEDEELIRRHCSEMRPHVLS